jgi:hypothetical protein
MVFCADNRPLYHEGKTNMAKTILEKLGWAATKSSTAHNVPTDLASMFSPVIAHAETPPVWSLWFVPEIAALNTCADAAAAAYIDGGHLWFAYPKLSGSLKTDITRDAGWTVLDAHTLMPVSQIAIDATWSALRFRRRHEIKKITRKT